MKLAQASHLLEAIVLVLDRVKIPGSYAQLGPDLLLVQEARKWLDSCCPESDASRRSNFEPRRLELQ